MTLVIVPILVAGILWYLQAGAAEPARDGKTESTRRGVSPPIVVEHCRVKLIDEVTLAADRAGVLAFVEPREGDRVTAGAQVAALRDEIPRAALAVAELEAASDIELRHAQKTSQVAQAEYQSIVEAHRRNAGSFSENDLRRQKMAAERGVLEVENAEYRRVISRLKRDQALAELQTYHIAAPFEGVVMRVHRARGEAVRQGDPIVEIVNTNKVRVEGYVAFRDSWRVKPGGDVSVRLEIPDVELELEQRRFSGRITFVEERVEPVTGQVRVWAEVENREGLLKAGLAAIMTIEVP